MRITDEMAAGASVKNVDTSPERDKKGDDSLHDEREAARGAADAVVTVTDAATEELEAQLTNAKAGWESALRIVNEGNEIIKQVGAERDAAIAALQRVRDRHQPCLSCLEPHCFVCEKAKWPCAEFRALEGDE